MKNLKGKKLLLQVPARQLNEKPDIIETNCIPTGGREEGSTSYSMPRTDLDTVGLKLAKCTQAKEAGRTLSKAEEMRRTLNDWLEELLLHVSRCGDTRGPLNGENFK